MKNQGARTHKNIAKINNIKIQVGGGVRSLEQIDQLLNVGVDKIILGTKAIEDLNFLKNACEKFKGKIALAIDVRNGFIALSGWKKQTDILASDFIKKKGVKQVSDKSEIEALIKSVLQKNVEMVNDYKKGKDKLFGFFVGQVMKESKGKANPQLVNQVLKDLLSK